MRYTLYGGVQRSPVAGFWAKLGLYTTGALIGFSAGAMVVVAQIQAGVQPVVTQDSDSSLSVEPLQHNSRLVTTYQTQGGNVQRLQLTVRSNKLQPTTKPDSYQGNQEDGDNLQPALGYGALNWALQ